MNDELRDSLITILEVHKKYLMAVMNLVHQGADKQRIIDNLSDVWMITYLYIDLINKGDKLIIDFANKLRSYYERNN